MRFNIKYIVEYDNIIRPYDWVEVIGNWGTSSWLTREEAVGYKFCIENYLQEDDIMRFHLGEIEHPLDPDNKYSINYIRSNVRKLKPEEVRHIEEERKMKSDV